MMFLKSDCRDCFVTLIANDVDEYGFVYSDCRDRFVTLIGNDVSDCRDCCVTFAVTVL